MSKSSIIKHSLVLNWFIIFSSIFWDDIIKLIFVPSFSQKESVDELSGRGVGMDIVEKNMKKLGGNIDIETEVGKGTTFTLKIKS